MIQPTQNPQQAPVRALLELLTEHPELPAMNWQILTTGALRGTLHNFEHADLTAEVTAWAEFLNAKGDTTHYFYEQKLRSSRSLYTTWRGVELSLSFYAPASVDEAERVAA